MDFAVWLTLALTVVNLFLIVGFGLRRRNDNGLLEAWRSGAERLERGLREEVGRSAQGTRVELGNSLGVFQQTLLNQQGEAARTLNERLRALSDANERRLADVRTTVEQRLTTLQQGNEQKLEQMRATVDEKLHATLELRLGESFKQVSDRLEQVHRGLGEMQSLAAGGGDLQKMLSNLKTRGTWGQGQPVNMLEHMLIPSRYGNDVVNRARCD